MLELFFFCAIFWVDRLLYIAIIFIHFTPIKIIKALRYKVLLKVKKAEKTFLRKKDNERARNQSDKTTTAVEFDFLKIVIAENARSRKIISQVKSYGYI